jgi:predicted nucleic-acid-binding Zn-ribbon protein
MSVIARDCFSCVNQDTPECGNCRYGEYYADDIGITPLDFNDEDEPGFKDDEDE